MAYKDKNKERESRLRWQRSKVGKACRIKYRQKNLVKIRSKNREYARVHREEQKANGKAWYKKIKHQAIETYAGKHPACNCCGENFYPFLTLDHVNGDGAQHRKEIGGTTKIYTWLRDNNYPPGFQVLCHNCNIAKGTGKICPCSVKCKSNGSCEL